jgi:hypothetical protein
MTNKPEPNTRAGEALKPCPWCSGKGFAQSPSLGHSSWRVICDDCCAEGPTVPSYNVDDPEAFCIIAWNNRIGNVAMSTWDHYAEEHVDTRPLPQPSELVERLLTVGDDHAVLMESRDFDYCAGCPTDGCHCKRAVAETLAVYSQAAAQIAKLQIFADEQFKVDSEIQAHQQQQLAKMQADGDKLAGALEACRAELFAPEPNCSCHISPPCGDCVDYASVREADELATQALTEWKDRA